MKSIAKCIINNQPVDPEYLAAMEFIAPSPLWAAPSEVARFLDSHLNGHAQYMHIKLENGRFTCHCRHFKIYGRCEHVQGWQFQLQQKEKLNELFVQQSEEAAV